VFCWDPAEAEVSRRRFFGQVAGTDAKILPIHFPDPSVGLVEEHGDRFRWRYLR
jgi:hypothetical protein